MLTFRPQLLLFSCILMSVCALTSACSDDISSDEEARQAYLSLDPVVAQALDLGFEGFNAASSANIPAQSAAGPKGGTISVAGKVNQGSSSNKNMDLTLGLVGWTADTAIVFHTSTDTAAQPKLTLSLKKLPDADLTGTLVGTFTMTGDLKRAVVLNLSIVGKTMADSTGKIVRKPGSMRITASRAWYCVVAGRWTHVDPLWCRPGDEGRFLNYSPR